MITEEEIEKMLTSFYKKNIFSEEDWEFALSSGIRFIRFVYREKSWTIQQYCSGRHASEYLFVSINLVFIGKISEEFIYNLFYREDRERRRIEKEKEVQEIKRYLEDIKNS